MSIGGSCPSQTGTNPSLGGVGLRAWPEADLQVVPDAGHAILIRFIWKSASGGDIAYGRPSKRAEWLWSLVPVLLMVVVSEAGVLLVSGPVWDSLYAEEPENPVVVEVIGKQFEWYVHYPGADGQFGDVDLRRVDEQVNLLGLGMDELGFVSDAKAKDDIVKRGQLWLPVGRPAVIRLRTFDVIHSFFLPDLRVKQDAVPGMVIPVWFEATRSGEYDWACAELCGLGHYRMRASVTVHEAADYEQWQASQTAPAAARTAPGDTTGAKPTTSESKESA